MSSLIKKPAALDVPDTAKIGIYGQPGLGKTTLGLSAPSPLLFDTDGGIHRVDPRHQVPTVQVRKYEDILDVLDEDLGEYKTFVFDTAGRTLDFMSEYLVRTNPKLGTKDGGLTLQGYGARKTLFINLLNRVSMMGKNLVFIAHEKEEKGTDDQKIIRPEIGGSSAGDLIKELDLVGYMEAFGKKRTISFNPCEKYYAKNACRLPEVMEIPNTVDGDRPATNDFLSGIVKTYKDNLEARQKIASRYNDILDTVEDYFNRATPETINDVCADVKKIEHIWDSLLQCGKMASKRAKELKLKLNQETKLYEPEAVPADESKA